jgi:hypothetical protein
VRRPGCTALGRHHRTVAPGLGLVELERLRGGVFADLAGWDVHYGILLDRTRTRTPS